MRTFKNGSWTNEDTCPICRTDSSGEVILVPISGTRDGNMIQATQVHTSCLGKKLKYLPKNNIIIASCNISKP